MQFRWFALLQCIMAKWHLWLCLCTSAYLWMCLSHMSGSSGLACNGIRVNKFDEQSMTSFLWNPDWSMIFERSWRHRRRENLCVSSQPGFSTYNRATILAEMTAYNLHSWLFRYCPVRAIAEVGKTQKLMPLQFNWRWRNVEVADEGEVCWIKSWTLAL